MDRICKKGWVCTAKDKNGTFYTVEHGKTDLHAVERDYKKGRIKSADGDPLELIEAYPRTEYHLYKYCKGIAKGGYEDLLCDECKMSFGHTLYSEL